jgi:hypothetical protein
MNDVPIQIRNPEVVRAIRALATESGQPITQAVAGAVAAELQRRRSARDEDQARRLAAIRQIVKQFQKLPIVGPGLTDEDLYDEDGLPR